MPTPKHPALTYALRGIAGFEVTLHGPARDLHSGIFGGTVDNPAMALCQLLGKLRDKDGRVAIPGFYDGVQPLSAYERKQFARLPFNARDYQRLLGVPKLFGERGFTPIEQRSARPTFEINGLTSGYQGEGSKTIVPAWARAKITIRLVPNQDPDHVTRRVRHYLEKLCPPTVRLEIKGRHGAEPYLVSPTGPQAQAALRALKSAFGCEPVLDPRRRLNPHRQRLQEDPPRRLPPARPGPSRRQRPLAQREIRPGLLRQGAAHERVSLAGTKPCLSRMVP